MLLTMFSSCNIFEPREAEKPVDPAKWNSFPTTPYLCLENLVYSYDYRENVFNYGTLFNDIFIFNFDPQDVRDFTVPVRWFKQQETEMLMNVHLQSGRTRDMTLNLFELSNQPDIIQAQHAWIFREYILFLNHTQPNLANEFTGIFQLYLERESNGFWRIHEWHDYRGNSEWTFGRMKNAFGS